MTRRLFVAVAALLAIVAILAGVKMTGSSSATYVSSSTSNGTVSAASDWTPPTVAVTKPAAVVKGTITIAATATDAISGVDKVTIQGAPTGTSTWTTICEDTTAPYSCDYATVNAPDGAYDLRATAVDKSGNTATSATVSTIVANNLTVTLTSPDGASTLGRGTVEAKTTVSNAGGVVVTSARVEYATTGTTGWSTLCTPTSVTSPLSCSFDSKSLATGTYDLRSVVIADTATFTSPTVSRVLVDNTAPTVTMSDPGATLTGTTTFTATASDAHSGIAQVAIQYTSGTTWSVLCTPTSAPYSCSYDTSKLSNGTYSFRAVATDNVGLTTTSTAVTGRTVSNVATTVTLAAPKAHISADTTLTATATSNKIASVRFEYAATGSDKWITISASTTASYTATFATSGLAEGTYQLRAVVTDADGRTATSAVVSTTLDKTKPKGADIQTTNGGVAGKIDAGDTIVYTFSEQVDLSSIYSGWSGTATSGTVRIPAFFSQSFDISSPSTFRLGAVDLNANFGLLFEQSTDSIITASTVTVDGIPRTVITVKIVGSMGYQVSTKAAMSWTPASAITDLAGNTISTTAVAESGDLDVDF